MQLQILQPLPEHCLQRWQLAFDFLGRSELNQRSIFANPFQQVLWVIDDDAICWQLPSLRSKVQYQANASLYA